MSLEPSPALNLYIKQKNLNEKLAKSELVKKRLDQKEIFKISALKLSPHPSFIFKKQIISKNLSKLKEQIQIRCATRAMVRPKTMVITEPNGFLKTNRFNKRKSEDLDWSQKNNLNFFNATQQLSSQSVKNLNLAALGKNVLVRKKPRYLLRNRKNMISENSDAYHCSKYLSGEKATSFYEMLEVFYESPTVFPYFNKSTKEYINEEFSPIKQRNFSLSSLETQVASVKKLNKKKNSQKKNSLIPVLETRFYNPQPVLFGKNVIVINFESINIGNSIVFRPGVVNELIQVSGIYHIVIVSSLHGEEFPDILEKFERLSVKISAFYAVINQAYLNFKFLNYSEIFQDFRIDDPLKSCLIISNHLIFDSVEEVEYIASVYGAKIKLNCEKIPVLYKKISKAPIVVLIPGFTSGKSVDLLKFIVSNVIFDYNFIEESAEINFFELLKAKNCKMIASETTQKVLKNFLTVSPLVKESYSLDHIQYFIL